jgi:PEP-CTERM motif
MKRLLAILVLAGASAQAQTSSYGDLVGTVPNLLFYKNQKSQGNQITSVASSSSFQARYGYWDFQQNTFSALWPDFYLPGNSLLSSDPDYLTVSFDPSSGVAALSGVVHPFIPELLNDPTSAPRPYAPPGPNQSLGIEFLYTENLLSISTNYFSIVLLNAYDGAWLSANDQAVLGQIEAQGSGTAITMVPEPSSLSLLLAGGAVFAATRRRRSV